MRRNVAALLMAERVDADASERGKKFGSSAGR
jgi:hypothetical protein